MNKEIKINEEKEGPKERTKIQSLSLQVNNLPKFDDEEILSGGDVDNVGYVASFPFMVRLDGSDFIITGTNDETRGVEFHRAKKLEVIAFFGHDVWRLHKGTTRGLSGDMNDWTEEDKSVVAQTYANPFSNAIKSRGSFDIAGYGEYLDDQELRRGVKKRLYLIVAIPGILPKGDLAICTFGGTSLIPYKRYNSALQRINCPVSWVKTELSLKRKTNDAGQKYEEVYFSGITGKDNSILPAWKSKTQWETIAKPILLKIREAYREIIKTAETSTPEIEKSFERKEEEEETIVYGGYEQQGISKDWEIPF